jgi:hypothetical protein
VPASFDLRPLLLVTAALAALRLFAHAVFGATLVATGSAYFVIAFLAVWHCASVFLLTKWTPV